MTVDTAADKIRRYAAKDEAAVKAKRRSGFVFSMRVLYRGKLTLSKVLMDAIGISSGGQCAIYVTDAAVLIERVREDTPPARVYNISKKRQVHCGPVVRNVMRAPEAGGKESVVVIPNEVDGDKGTAVWNLDQLRVLE